jgi:hypothetical protein
MSLDELKENLTERGYENSVVFENPSYVDAIIGISDDGAVCYSYEKMIKYLMDTDNMEYEDAMEFIDYNTIRALPYASSLGGGGIRPIVIYDDFF